MNTAWCPALFNELCISPNGAVTPCCSYTGAWGSVQTQKASDLFFSPEAIMAREISQSEATPLGCKTCAIHEQRGSKSKRQKILARSSLLALAPIPVLSKVEISTGNQCNLHCVMCSSQDSSKWEKLEIDMQMQNLRTPKSPPATRYQFHEDIIKDLLLHHPQLRSIEFIGGEPLLNKKVLAVLPWLQKHNSHIDLNITTNGLLFNDEWGAALEGFQNLLLVISVDAIGETYQKIRGAPFEKLEEKLELICKWLPHATLHINPTVFLWNMMNISELIFWLEKKQTQWNKKLILNLNQIVSHPEELSPYRILHSDLPILREEIERLENHNSTVISSADLKFYGRWLSSLTGISEHSEKERKLHAFYESIHPLPV